MPRKKATATEGATKERAAKAAAPSEAKALQAENEKLKAKLAKFEGKKPKRTDGAVTFKSPWPKFQQLLRRGMNQKVGYDDYIQESPVFAYFDNGVCTLRPSDTFVDVDGKVVKKIDRMRDIYKQAAVERRRPEFVEVTDETDLEVVTFRERVPPAQLVEFRGPLVPLPEIPPPPKEAAETIETIEGKRSAYGG